MLILLLYLSLLGQSPEVRTIVKSGVEVRTMTITVHGNLGRPPRRLIQEDFTVFENGVRQPISLFVKNTDDPKAPRYQIGYPVTPSAPGDKKRIEIRIRGFRKKIQYDVVAR
jgi:hypothetical protein